MCFEINTSLITFKKKHLFGLLLLMCVRFGAYEKTYSTGSIESRSAVSVARARSAFIIPPITTLVQPLLFEGSMPCISAVTITIGCL